MTRVEGGASWAVRARRSLDAVPVLVFTAAVATGAGLCWLFLLHGQQSVAAPLRIPWPLLALAFAGGHFAVIRVDFKGESHSVDLTDVVLLPAIVFAGPGPVLLAAAIGTLIRSVLVRRPVVKAAFNVSLHVLAVALAILAYRALLADAGVLSLRGLAAALIAVVVAEVATHLAIQAAISLSSGRPVVPRLDQIGPTLLLMIGFDAVLGVTALEMLWSGRVGGGVVFVAVAGVIAAGYAVHGRLRSRHLRLDQLYRFEQTLARVAESSDAVAAVLHEALALLNAEEAQLVCDDGAQRWRYALRLGQSLPVAIAGAHPLEAITATISDGIVLSRASSDLARGTLEAAGIRDALAVRLPTDGQVHRLLVVTNRLGVDYVTFTSDDLALAETLAPAAAMALRSTGLLDQLRTEIAIKDHQATHDGLTGLANRTLFTSELERVLAARTGDALVAVMLIDLDGFKKLNDTLGHEAGDRFLQALARRVQTVVGGADLIGRLGGDEFAVLLAAPASVGQITEAAEAIDQVIRAPVSVVGSTVQLRASIGVAVAPLCGEDRFTTLRQADLAMYRAKQAGGGVRLQETSHAELIDRFSLVNALREAIDTSSLRLHYQPKVSFVTGQVTGVEALLRWAHPIYGRVPTEQFIPVAEASGLIRPITEWVLRTAIAQAAAWRDQGLPLDMAVNVSPEQIGDQIVVAQLRGLLATYGMPGSAVTLEVTESGVVRKWGRDTEVALDSLAELGVRLAIDDFGVGTSSLSRLKDLHVDELKVDKSFITNLVRDSTDAAIVGAAIGLAHQLAITVTAEGIETASGYQQLAEMGCDAAQGYFISVPLAPDELTQWLRHNAGYRSGTVSQAAVAAAPGTRPR